MRVNLRKKPEGSKKKIDGQALHKMVVDNAKEFAMTMKKPLKPKAKGRSAEQEKMDREHDKQVLKQNIWKEERDSRKK